LWKKNVLLFQDSQAKDYEIRGQTDAAFGLFGLRKMRMVVSACPPQGRQIFNKVKMDSS